MKTETKHFLNDLAALLSYQQSAGIDAYPATGEVRRFLHLEVLKARKDVGGVSRLQGSQSGGVKRSTTQEMMSAPKGATKEETEVLSDIAGEVIGCHACSLIESRVMPTAGRGDTKARLLVVGDWLAVAAGRQMSQGTLFGIEQDRMLERMLGAIGMDPGEVFVTNVIKCAIPENRQPLAEHVHACQSYLRRQIAAVKPEAILAMGMIAARTLLERPEPLSRLRGRLHTYSTADSRSIALIATYHPTFLLQHPEMKKATWIDLQLLARQLGTTLA